MDDNLLQYVDGGIKATEEDWGTEYLDLIVSMKTVKGIDEAIAHINKYNTGHSESIVTKSYANAQKFLDQVDAAAVYVNASTRFTDGAEFGLGAEIGISTQKLHARGPMGLKGTDDDKIHHLWRWTDPSLAYQAEIVILFAFSCSLFTKQISRPENRLNKIIQFIK